jgi:hypothetical protein
MKKILILFIIFSGFSLAQEAKRELTKNIHNDKYMQKYHYQNNNRTIVCESNRNRRSHCPIDTRNGVNFIRQLSNASCSYNWGYDAEGVWVTSGCSAEFSTNTGWDQSGAENNALVCESRNYQRNYCRAGLAGRDVFLVRQLSTSPCINNWGFDKNGVWVTNGCRGEFAVEDRYATQNDIIVCSSRNSQFQSCRANTRGGVEFVRQLSRSSCNRNWGYDDQGIWVTNGCRASFRLIPFYTNDNDFQNSVVSCSSRNLRRAICPADTRGGVRLKKQKSRASCRGNWGFTANHIWVDKGCRATFQLNINSNQHNNSRQPGYGRGDHHSPSQPQNSNILCESLNSRHTTCAIPLGAKVQLLRQLSRSSCNNNWGYNRREIWVSNGCRAEFSVF